MKCASCQSWATLDGKSGTCSHLGMRISFTPYSDPMAALLGYNRDRPSPMPKTTHDYGCEHWS